MHAVGSWGTGHSNGIEVITLVRLVCGSSSGQFQTAEFCSVGAGWFRLYVENYIVDASILKCCSMTSSGVVCGVFCCFYKFNDFIIDSL